jgi:hypothetical protein
MIINLKVRPISGGGPRQTILPRAVRPAIRQQPAVTKALRATIQSKPTPQVGQRRQVVQNVRPNAQAVAVMPRRGAVASQKTVAQSKRTTVKIITRDPPPESTRKLRELHNSSAGRVLVIIANGPSVLEIDTTRLLVNPLIDIMSINKPDQRVWPTKYWLFCDISQLKRHHSLWSEYNGYIFNSTMITESRPGTILIKNIPGQGFSLDLTSGFNIGRSSVYAAMQVALWLGYDKIYIFGIDMGAVTVDGKETLHFYGVNPDCTSDNRKKRFAEEAKYYDNAANTLPTDVRKKFYFCSSYNKFKFLDAFHRLDHHEALELLTSSK